MDEEPLLGLDVGRDRPEQRRLRLVGAVGTAETLDGGIGLPARLQQIVHPQPLVLRRKVGMVAAPGAAGVREHQNALHVVHESLRLGQIGRSGAGFDRKAVDPVGAALAHDAARPAGDLRHHVGAESLHDLVERALHGGERGQMLDHAVAPFHRLAALHRLAVAQDRPRRQIAVLVGERLEQLGREAVCKVDRVHTPSE